MSGLPKETTQLPVELYFSICAHVASRRDLCTLAATSCVLQRPSETELQQRITIPSKDYGKKFIDTMKKCPRFTLLIRELRLEFPLGEQEIESTTYWSDIHDVLGQLTALESLTINDGRDLFLSWVLSAIPENRLKILRCAFILDAELLNTLRKQASLEELSWTGALISLDPLPVDSNSSYYENTPHGPNNTNIGSGTLSFSDPDDSLISIFRQLLPPAALPHLKALHSESLGFARILVPGRQITHLWVPGVTFAALVTSEYVYRHITSVSVHDVDAWNISLAAKWFGQDPTRSVQLARPRLVLPSSERAAHMCRAIEDFALGIGPVLSFRIALDLSPHALTDVLSCISRNLPELRALGFLPASVLDPMNDEKDSSLNAETSSVTPLPCFRHLHTICLWSTPSRRAVIDLEHSTYLPALRTLACLHFSPAFEWLCLPLNDVDGETSEGYHGGIQWKHETGVEGKNNTRRRLTAVHDPENQLWRDV